MQITATPANKSVDQGQLSAMLSMGWTYLGRMLINTGSGIVTPGQQPVADVHVWVMYEPTVPIAAVVAAIADHGADTPEFDNFCQALFSTSFAELREKHHNMQMQQMMAMSGSGELNA